MRDDNVTPTLGQEEDARPLSAEERLRIALEVGGLGVWSYDPATDVVDWADNVLEALGLADPTYIRTAADYQARVHPEDRADVQAALQAVVDGSAPDFESEHRLILPDGSVRWVESRGRMVHNPGAAPRLEGILRDITARKQTEEALRLSEERLQMALEAGRVDVWSWDLSTDESYTTTYTANVAGLDSALLGNNMEDYLARVHPDDREMLVGAVQACIAGATPELVVEYRVSKVDGQLQWIETRGKVERDSTGVPRSLIGTMLDITERKQMEAALRAGEERLHMALEAGQIDVWSWNYVTGESFTTAYMSAVEGLDEALNAQSAEEYIQRIHPDDLAHVMSAMESCIRGEAPEYRVEYRELLPDGGIQWLESRGRLGADKDGNPYVLTGTMRDITALKTAGP
jgi:PAS domain S-box-containing protein